ncbi:hypothetical protein N7478_001074 [Penicillium angulare]|uniref:uncharacterized protein n=1 Tax=Penicillium angulare TaxID=116970 RepID=UPI00253FB286|nr:uncharacterized protein N7478_001074 [Penicillium angulare]KAJ5291823.1 hypothetical protein N7478_001074 [Penicillium angulare]
MDEKIVVDPYEEQLRHEQKLARQSRQLPPDEDLPQYSPPASSSHVAPSDSKMANLIPQPLDPNRPRTLPAGSGYGPPSSAGPSHGHSPSIEPDCSPEFNARGVEQYGGSQNPGPGYGTPQNAGPGYGPPPTSGHGYASPPNVGAYAPPPNGDPYGHQNPGPYGPPQHMDQGYPLPNAGPGYGTPSPNGGQGYGPPMNAGPYGLQNPGPYGSPQPTEQGYGIPPNAGPGFGTPPNAGQGYGPPPNVAPGYGAPVPNMPPSNIMAIPALTPDKDAPFIRAYPPMLQNHQIPQDFFFRLLDKLNDAMGHSPPMQVLDVTGGMLSSVPILFPLRWIGASVSSLANFSSQEMGKSKADGIVRTANKEIFNSRGLIAQIAKLPAVAQITNMPVLDSEGNIDPNAPLINQLSELPCGGTDLANEVDFQQRRIQLFQPWIAPLVVDTDLPWKGKSGLHKFNAKVKNYHQGAARKHGRGPPVIDPSKADPDLWRALWLVIRPLDEDQKGPVPPRLYTGNTRGNQKAKAKSQNSHCFG